MQTSLLKVAILLVLFAFLPAIGQATEMSAAQLQIPTQSEQLPRSPYPPLRQLAELKSENGNLNATFEVAEQKIDLGDGIVFDGYTYNGDYAAPVLRVNPGDVMHLKLINHLPNDDTNLHFHGLHTSPLANGDNVFIRVKPNQTFDYEIRFEKDQPPGLYWYHPHIHGISERMVNGGLSGVLVVGNFAQQFPELANIKEQILILKEYTAEIADTPELKRLHKIVQTINGQQLSTIPMHKGETQLWQIANPGPDDMFHIQVKGHKFRVLGWDGVSTNKEDLTDQVDIGPASRVEVLIDAGETPGNYEIISTQTPTGAGEDYSGDRILGAVAVDNDTVATAPTITTFPDKPDLRKAKIDKEREVVFTETPDEGRYLLNNRIYSHDRIDTRVPLGNIEKWTIRNESDDFHVFHIHQLHFQVIEINGQSQPFNGYLDTVRIPSRGEVKLIIPFTDPEMIGKFVYHCHVLEHEDKGMMANIEVYDPKNENALVTLWKFILSYFQLYWTELFATHSHMHDM